MRQRLMLAAAAAVLVAGFSEARSLPLGAGREFMGAAGRPIDVQYWGGWGARYYEPRYVEPRYVEPAQDAIHPSEAVAIARSMGYRTISQPQLARGAWVLDTIDRGGARVRVSVDAFTGRPLQVRYLETGGPRFATPPVWPDERPTFWQDGRQAAVPRDGRLDPTLRPPPPARPQREITARAVPVPVPRPPIDQPLAVPPIAPPPAVTAPATPPAASIAPQTAPLSVEPRTPFTPPAAPPVNEAAPPAAVEPAPSAALPPPSAPYPAMPVPQVEPPAAQPAAPVAPVAPSAALPPAIEPHPAPPEPEVVPPAPATQPAVPPVAVPPSAALPPAADSVIPAPADTVIPAPPASAMPGAAPNAGRPGGQDDGVMVDGRFLGPNGETLRGGPDSRPVTPESEPAD